MTVAVNDFNVTIPGGKLIGLLGPSGCGKSTTLYMIAGLHKPTRGKIFFGDEDVTDVPPEKRGIGLVFQNYALYPHMTVKQNIMFPLENMKPKMPKEEALERAMKMAELVQIGDSKVVSLKGKVVALDVDGYFYLADSTGVIYVRTKLPEGVVSGDNVVVDGQTSVYLNSNKQYTRQINANNISKIEEEVAVMEAVKTAISDFPSLEAESGVLSDAAIETIKAYSNYGKLVEITGFVKIRGSYGNAYICEANDDTSAGLLVYYKSDKQDELKAYEGKKVTVVICVYDANGYDGWRLESPLSITEVTE